MKTKSHPHGSASGSFISKFGDRISGVLEGFDRLRLRGTLRQLYCPTVMEAYLHARNLMYRDFKSLAERTTKAIKTASEQIAENFSRPLIYLSSSRESKEQKAREIARRDGIDSGLISVLSCVEPCQSYSLRRKEQEQGFEFRLELRKCLHFYFYFEHPRFGFCHVRLQSWFPFQVDIMLNGRHWLARQLDDAGIAYRKRENALVWVEDFAAAQHCLDEQIHTNWQAELQGFLEQVHPNCSQICAPLGLKYYWTMAESEYATDVLFRRAEDLAKIYPGLVHHALSSFGAPDVMRFLGHRAPTTTGRVTGQFKGEIISDLKHRPEGIRVKHSLDGNSLKIYDKHGSVLRVETTINHPERFRIYRKPESQPEVKPEWRVLRRSVADSRRRAQICQAANYRYLEALAAVSGTIPLFKWANEVCRPLRRGNHRFRALNPLSPGDGALLEAVNRGEFNINGFRNSNLRALLYPAPKSKKQQDRQARSVGRKILLLRAHGLVAKVSHTNRYVITDKGRVTITALLSARQADVDSLTKMAA